MLTLTEIRVIHAFGVTFASLSFLSACLVIYFILNQKKSQGLLQRFPTYICAIEIAFNIFHSFDHAYALAHDVPPPDPVCQIIGGAVEFFVGCQILFNCLIALTVYLAVCHGKQLDWGKYDWKLLSLSLVVPVVVLIFGFAFDLFGSEGLWCYVRRDKPYSRYIYLLFGAAPITLGMALTLFCYLSAIKRILHIPKEIKDRAIGKRLLATRKTSTYILVFMIQWIFPLFYAVTAIAERDSFAIRFLVMLMNAGGVFNLSAWIYNRISEKRLKKAMDISSCNTVAAETCSTKVEMTSSDFTTTE